MWDPHRAFEIQNTKLDNSCNLSTPLSAQYSGRQQCHCDNVHNVSSDPGTSTQNTAHN